MASERSSEREAAERVEGRPGRPLRHAVFQRARQLREGAGPGLTAANRVVALLASEPPSAERLGRIGGGDGDDINLLRASRPAYARHASMERVGKRTSSLRRVNRSSFTAKRSRPSCSSAAPESCPSQMPSTFTMWSSLRVSTLAARGSLRLGPVRRRVDLPGTSEARPGQRHRGDLLVGLRFIFQPTVCS